jgi:hypothetical protein
MSENVKELVKEINNTRTQTSASAKDEVRVMKAMLNDPEFVVDIYGRSGVEGQYCPYEESRSMISNIIRDAAKVSAKEATELANHYKFGKQEASVMVGISKEFINTYIETGRKLPLGGRETSNISIAKKVKEERANNFPKKVGVNEDGSDKYETVDQGVIPSHTSLKVYSSCPPWLKK